MNERGFIISHAPLLQSKWFRLARGWLCFVVLRPPEFSLTVEMRYNNTKKEVAICLMWFAINFQWNRHKLKVR